MPANSQHHIGSSYRGRSGGGDPAAGIFQKRPLRAASGSWYGALTTGGCCFFFFLMIVILFGR